MTEQKAGAQISTKAFLQAVSIIFLLMMVAGILTLVIPAGEYTRLQVDGREVIDPNSFRFIERPDFPIWRWFTAPFEVLATPDGLTKVVPIIVFILLVGTAFGIMDRSGIMQAVVARIVNAFGGRKYVLLLVITFFFMALGTFFGIFEEVIPLVPLMIGLAYYLGWDSLTGLGMSVLATNVGFSTAVFNPFTIGIAHQLSGLPLYSGAGPRIALFVVVYVILALFITNYAKKIERKPEASLVYNEDKAEKAKYGSFNVDDTISTDPRMKRGAIFLGVFFALILAVLVSVPLFPLLRDIALPLTGLLFVFGGIGAGLISGAGKSAWKAAWDGFIGITPAIPLLMMAASVKHIIASGGILDTVLHWANNALAGTSPFVSTLMIYALTLVLELFITSGSAKAFLLIPIIMPLADLVGVNRQIAVSAYTFGDGFSNMAYPTNAALLITLSLTVIPFPKWLRWVLGLWVWILLATIIFLAIAVATNYGPF
ncbi:MAG: AbgT family transporter [Anaerolineae bacterium]|nr:AbgT family transporter [Anaerolineae bacterium]